MSRPPVVPDCSSTDQHHDPPGPVPAAYWYQYRCEWSGADGTVSVFCPACLARVWAFAERPELAPAGCYVYPPPTRVKVLRDANTGEPVL